MTHQVVSLLRIPLKAASTDAPFSVARPSRPTAQAGTPVALTVALRYLATQRALRRVRLSGPVGDD